MCVRRVGADGLYSLSLSFYLSLSVGRFLPSALFSCFRFVFLFFKCDVLSTCARVFWLRSLWPGFIGVTGVLEAFTSFVIAAVFFVFVFWASGEFYAVDHPRLAQGHG